MLTFLARRVFVLLLTLLVASLVIFIILEVLPGDAALLILGIEAQADTLVALRAQMGPLKLMLEEAKRLGTKAVVAEQSFKNAVILNK